MLIFTHRHLAPAATDESALTRAYTPFSDTLNSVEVTPGPQGRWKVTAQRSALSDAAAVQLIDTVLKGDKPVLIYLHGNNTSPARCFARCDALQRQYDVAVIGFSWTSEGYMPDGTDLSGLDKSKSATDDDDEALSAVKSRDSLKEGWIARKARRYAQAKVNAQHSTDALARLLRLVASRRLHLMQQKVSLAVHSLGCHFLHYTVDQQDAEASLSAMHNVVLMAGCTGAAKHAAWVGRIHPLQRVYMTYTRADTVLFGAGVVDGDVKLGTAPGTDLLSGPKYRYIDFENARKMSIGAHSYFVAAPDDKLSKQAQLLFKRIFRCEADFEGGIEAARKVYPLGCRNDGSVCYMGNGTPAGEQ